MLNLKAALSALPLAAALFVTPATAAVTSIEFTSGSQNGIAWTPAGSSGSITNASPGVVTMNFALIRGEAGAAALQNLSAQFELGLTRRPDTNFFDGVFSFKYIGADFTYNGTTVHAGDTLLSGSLTKAFLRPIELVDYRGVADASHDMSLYSPFVSSFDEPDGHARMSMWIATNQPWPQALSSVPPVTAPVYGYFAAGVPEPATWAMMIMGFGMAGGAIRTRRRSYAPLNDFTAAPQ